MVNLLAEKNIIEKILSGKNYVKYIQKIFARFSGGSFFYFNIRMFLLTADRFPH